MYASVKYINWFNHINFPIKYWLWAKVRNYHHDHYHLRFTSLDKFEQHWEEECDISAQILWKNIFVLFSIVFIVCLLLTCTSVFLSYMLYQFFKDQNIWVTSNLHYNGFHLLFVLFCFCSSLLGKFISRCSLCGIYLLRVKLMNWMWLVVCIPDVMYIVAWLFLFFVVFWWWWWWWW